MDPVLDCLDSLTLEPSSRIKCDLYCKIQAASALIPFPNTKDGVKSPLLVAKLKVIAELTHLPASVFTRNQVLLAGLHDAIHLHLIYNIDEFERTITDTYEYLLDSPNDPSEAIFEPALDELILPIHRILLKIFKRLKSTTDENERAVIKKYFPPSFVQHLVATFESPIELERENMSAVLAYIGNNLTPDYVQALIAAFTDLASNIVIHERPVRGLEDILTISADLCVRVSKLDDTIKRPFIDLAETYLAPLHLHSHFALVGETYNQFLTYYLRFFHLEAGLDIKRTPFDPPFPDKSPFVNSTFVQEYRQSFLKNFPESNPEFFDLNQKAVLSVISYLTQFQFYPRAMVPEILRVYIKNVNAADDDILNAILTILSVDSLFTTMDATCREILHLLWTTESNFDENLSEVSVDL